jgi:hypothetical protein
MTVPMVRGYTVEQTAAFIDSHYDEDTRKKIYASVPSELRDKLGHLAAAEWYPRDYNVALLRGVAAVRNDNKGSYDDLVALGRFVAVEATNTFLKLLLKMLTPAMLFKKVPSIWERDTRDCGRYEADFSKVAENKVTLRLLGAEGYDHVCITSIGYFESVLGRMGKQDARIEQKGWSLATPSPSEVRIDIAWS